MAFDLFGKLRDLFEGDPAIRKVAGDPALSAEILLLFRMVLADGEVSASELNTLRRICDVAFGIGEEDFAKVVGWLQDYGYDTGIEEALATFRQFPRERRAQLARHMAEIAKADADLNEREVKLLARMLDVLRLDPRDVVAS